MLKKNEQTGKNAPSVTGGQRAVTLCAGVTQHSKTENVYIFAIANIQSFTSQIFGVVGPFSPLGFDVKMR